ncbi:NADH dehydrogenase [ubiquinone] 1 alpha subcomplex subunit 9, mitochondrial-like [Mya arenaria]|uniref:NADH dehydrogenase [ubiquinone] 1 alpha subcomplex subunit 9, mitochondrial-like n=1 Tax=Mya arenaria TaxID=6604 RepID=UPI0022E1112F|nr:NADH dehydrogenase [ubiquinone] 1 alpha subcomplex subunit 9, mitochondrial-like [Mya arenaria]
MAALARITTAGALRIPERLGSMYMVKRDKTSSANITNYNRGTGGRSSFSGLVVTVFGAKGTLGRFIVNRFGRIGSQVVVPYRGCPSDVRDLKLMGDLGQILFNPFELRDEESVRQVCQYSNIVINCIGKEFETRNYTYDQVHVEGARTIAKVAKQCGVERLIHVSALNAGNPGSKWHKSKLAGEEAVLYEFPEATIFRPADFVDVNDKFCNYYMSNARTITKFRPFYGQSILKNYLHFHNGGHQIKMPVLIRNVATGIVNAIKDPSTCGQIYQCVGPHAYTLRDLVTFIWTCGEYKGYIKNEYGQLYMKAYIREKMYEMFGVPVPKLTLDRLARETISDQLDPSLPTLEDLGVTPENVEDKIFYIMRLYGDRNGPFGDPLPMRMPVTPQIRFKTNEIVME